MKTSQLFCFLVMLVVAYAATSLNAQSISVEITQEKVPELEPERGLLSEQRGNEPSGMLEYLPYECESPKSERDEIADIKPSDVYESEDTSENSSVMIDSFRSYWDNYGISESERESYQDGVAWNNSNEGNMLRMQYHLHEIPLTWIELWSESDAALGQIKLEDGVSALNKNRFLGYRVDGIISQITRKDIPPEISRRYRVKHLYRSTITLGSGQRVELFSNSMPNALTAMKQPLKERVGAYAIFLKLGEKAENDLPVIYMLADSVAWYPDTPLGNLGMNYGLFETLDSQPLSPDAVRSRSRDLKLSTRNRECFYQMMNAVRHISAKEIRALASEDLKRQPLSRHSEVHGMHSVIPLFKNPIQERGHVFRISGVARKILLVRVDDEDVVKRMGLRQYFEVWLYTPEAPESPVLVLVPDLPKELKLEATGDFREDLTVTGFFFNTWGISSQNEEGKSVIRLVPLLMGSRPELSDKPKPLKSTWFDTFVITLFTVGLLFTWLALRSASRRDREFRTLKREENFRSYHGMELPNTPESIQKETDFSCWGEDDVPPWRDDGDDEPTREDLGDELSEWNAPDDPKQK